MPKHKYIETPEKMYELFQAYKKEVKDNPRTVNVFGGKDFDKRDNELERPLSMAGFDVFVMNQEGVRSKGVDQYFNNVDEAYNEYLSICSRIKKEIRADQVEGGMVGQYNPSITQRLNNLTEKVEQTNKGSVQITGMEIK